MKSFRDYEDCDDGDYDRAISRPYCGQEPN